jgi:outer membrane protein assembly factor BamB
MKVFIALITVALAVIVALVTHQNVRNLVSSSSESPPPSPHKKWEFITAKSRVKNCSFHPCSPPDELPEHTPAIDADGTIYAGGQSQLYALAPDGTVKWSHDVSSQVAYSPILYTFVDDGANVWFDFNSTMGTGGLFRVDRDGQGDAVLGGSFPVEQAGLAYDGSIIVVKQNGASVMSPKGELEPTVGAPWGMHAASNNLPHVMIGSPDAKEPRTIQWDHSGYDFVFASDSRAYHLVPSGDSVFLEPILTDGSIPWAASVGTKGGCFPPALGADGVVYVACQGQVTAVNPDGTQKWLVPIPGQRAGQPAIAADGTVYFGCEDSNVYAVTPEGKLLWKYQTGDRVLSTPAIAKNGTIFFGGHDHNLYAVDAEGKLKWRFSTGGRVFSPTIAPDGTIYALSADGKLYAITDLEQNGGLSGQWPKWAGDLRNTWREPQTN